MLRVGLTGELGSGKSTVARLMKSLGAVVLSSDAMGRALMQPGTAVYTAIVQAFGPGVVGPDGQLDRPALAQLAFDPVHPRVDELNALIHPPVIAEQEQQIAALREQHPDAIVVVESALLLTTRHAGEGIDWRSRFDRVVLVEASDAVKIERFVQRSAAGRTLSRDDVFTLQGEAKRRLVAQRIPSQAIAGLLVIHNGGDLQQLAIRTEAVYHTLERAAQKRGPCAA